MLSVTDQTASTTGFKDGTNTDEDDYEYDSFGNLIEDRNQGMSAISYNHLNLPVKINFGSESWKIEYLYTADGRKVKKKVPYDSNNLAGGIGYTEMDYMGGFHYQGGSLKFFATAEGYVNKTSSVYSYVYNYTDHLGNIRMSYA